MALGRGKYLNLAQLSCCLRNKNPAMRYPMMLIIDLGALSQILNIWSVPPDGAPAGWPA
jgi:hypothetical protein